MDGYSEDLENMDGYSEDLEKWMVTQMENENGNNWMATVRIWKMDGDTVVKIYVWK